MFNNLAWVLISRRWFGVIILQGQLTNLGMQDLQIDWRSRILLAKDGGGMFYQLLLPIDHLIGVNIVFLGYFR